MQITDTHYIAGDPRSQRALDCVREAVANVKPDLVIHTGDIVFGSPDRQSILEILRPISDSGIPFAVALGNHDAQFGSTREEIFAAARSLPGCVNTAPKKGVYGCSNDVITLSGPNGRERAFFLFDSMDQVEVKGLKKRSYDYIRFSQLGWYRDWSLQLREANGGKPLPALAFFHIPLREMADGVKAEDHTLTGNMFESPAPSKINSGLLAQFVEMGDVQAVVNGHEHDCDFVLKYGPMYYIYGRYSGCDTVYNHLGVNGKEEPKVSGVRMFEFRSGEPGFRTWVRLYGGEIQQELSIEP